MAINREDDVERTLAALRDAKTPEGMEARIADRLALHATSQRAEFRWREVFAGSALAGAWWRGAVSGVAVAMLVMGLVWMAGHRGRSSAGHVAVRERAVAAVPPALAVRDDVRSAPCASPGGVRVKGTVVRTSEGVRVVATQIEVSHPAPAMGLTAQERELVQLAHKGDVKELISLDPEMRAKAEAQDAADFQKFFAEPVSADAPPAPKVDNE
jgi:hypothetical protein